MKGDDFNSIYERNYRRSFLFTKSYVHDDMAAEDIVAESLVKYWRLSLSQEAETSETLLLTILKNKALDYLRHKVIHESAIENIMELNDRELNIVYRHLKHVIQKKYSLTKYKPSYTIHYNHCPSKPAGYSR